MVRSGPVGLAEALEADEHGPSFLLSLSPHPVLPTLPLGGGSGLTLGSVEHDVSHRGLDASPAHRCVVWLTPTGWAVVRRSMPGRVAASKAACARVWMARARV